LIGLYSYNSWGQDTVDETEEEEFQSETESDDIAIEPEISGRIGVEQWFRDINKTSRLNPENEISKINESKRIFEVHLEISDYLDEDESLRWLSKLKGFKVYEKNNQNEGHIKFDELFIDWSGDEWFVSLGKRRNSWGPALAFNPVNVVVPERDPLDPSQQSEGHPIFLLNYGGDILTWEVILTRDYDQHWYSEYDRWGTRFGFIFGEIDIGLYYFDGEKTKNDEEYNQMIGASYSSNLFDNATLYIEAARFKNNQQNYYQIDGSVENRDESVYRVAIGSSITIDGNTSFFIEAFHNTGGYTTTERENYYLAVDQVLIPFPDPTKFGIFSDKQFSEMNKNYLLLSFSKREIYEKFGLSLQTLAAEDGSANSEISGSYVISDYYFFQLTFKGYSGNKNSEFGNNESNLDIIASLNCSF